MNLTSVLKKNIYIYIYVCVCVCVCGCVGGCVCLNHFAVHLKLTQHCKLTILQLKKEKACIIMHPIHKGKLLFCETLLQTCMSMIGHDVKMYFLFWIVGFFYCNFVECLYLAHEASLCASQVVLVVKNPLANSGDARDAGLIFWLGTSPGLGNGNPPQYCCLEFSWKINALKFLQGKFRDRVARRAKVHGAQRVRHN